MLNLNLHKPVRHKFQRNRVFVSDIDRQFQADLVDMQSLAEFNKEYKYLLTCIDLFSKFAWAVPLKDKFGKSVKSGLEIIFKERKPKVLQTDAAVGENNSTRPLNSKIKANAGEKQLNSSVGTKQLNSTGENNSTRQHERNNSTGENNSTQQQERTTQLGSRNETTQLASINETTQL
ncbi:uncharacterized transposon-derived protein F54H12.3 [Trichonephila clavipes]|nr:uncharacterized transposon-derived protein F54H12.3 [Trichonephila clavipes]